MLHQRALLRLALPNYAALLSSVVAGVIDVAWVARLGPAAVAAVTVATNVENFLLGVILLASGGLTVTLSGRLAAGDHAGVRTAVRGGWRIFAVLTPLVAIGGFALRVSVATLFLDDPHAIHLAVEFLAISLPTVAIFYAQQMVDAVLAGHGDTRTPMHLALVTNTTLLALDPVLIYGWLGAPRLGVVGAALATAIARSVALAVGLCLLRRLGTPGPTAPLGPTVRRVIATGAPIAGDFLVRQTGALATVAIVGHFGVIPIAAYGIGIKVLYVATMGFYALRNAAAIHTPRVLAISSDEPSARRQLELQTLRLALAAGLGASLLFAGMAPWIPRLFTADPQVIATGTSFLRWISGYLVPISGVIALGGVLMGSRRGPRLFAITVTGTLAQAAMAWGLSSAIGPTGVWIAMAASATFQLTLTLALTRPPRVLSQRRLPGGSQADADSTPAALSTTR